MKNIGKISSIFLAFVLFISIACISISGCEKVNYNKKAEEGGSRSSSELFEKYKIKCVSISDAKPGDYISLGKWEQDGNNENGDEEIEWLVLDEADGKLLVITRYAIEGIKYLVHPDGGNWESSYARKWANETFYQNAFDEDEKSKILLTHLVTEVNPVTKFRGACETEDYCFILSVQEVLEYFENDDERKAVPCPKLKENDSESSYFEPMGWWTRTVGGSERKTAYVDKSGEVIYSGAGGYDAYNLTRPAMWIEK